MKGTAVPMIFVDADGCPVKEEVYRVVRRCNGRAVAPLSFNVTLVANTWMRVPEEGWLKMVVVEGQLNAADDWIAEHAGKDDIVITGDIPLAARCLAKGAAVLGQRGGVFTEAGIGQALAGRELMSHLRETGTITGGPAAFEPRDRSRFLQRLDETIHAISRRARR